MLRFLCRLLAGRTTGEEEVVGLRREVQGLRLDLQEKEEQVRRLKAETEYLRQGEERRTQAAVDIALESLFKDLASPVAQLLAQERIVAEGGEVRPRDVLMLARQMVQALADRGLSPIGRAGERAVFSEAQHQPLDGSPVAEGESVVVRFPGFAFRGRVVRKAMVQKQGDD